MESPGYRFTSHHDCTKMALTPPLKVQEVTPALRQPGGGGSAAPHVNQVLSRQGPDQTQQSPEETSVSDKAGVGSRRGVQSVVPGWLYTVTTSILNVPMHVPRKGMFFE